jgi:hypothetical protein
VDAATRVLVLANPTADSIEPRQQLLARHGQGPIAVTVLAPAIWEIQDPHGVTESAWRRPRAAQKRPASRRDQGLVRDRRPGPDDRVLARMAARSL